MNKKILTAIVVAVIITTVSFVGLKTILGDKAVEVPGEEHTEKALNIQEKNASSNQLAQSSLPSSAESKESGP